MPKDDYYGADKTAEVCMIWPTSAADQMGKMVEQCLVSDKNIVQRISTNQNIAIKAGFVAEELHAESFNLDAILKGKSARAFTDQYLNTPLSGNNPSTDILVMDDGKICIKAQSKYYKTPADTAKELRRMDNGQIKYSDNDQYLAPADQINDIKSEAHKTVLKESSKSSSNRQQVAEAAKNVEQKATGKLKHNGIESKDVTLKKAKDVASYNKEGKTACSELQNEYKTKSTLQNMGKAAIGAAAISTVIAGTINTFQYLKLVKEGKISEEEALKGILTNTAIAAGDSALKAAAATGAVSTTARFFPSLFSSTLASSATTGGVAGATICIVDAAQCLILNAAGKMTIKQVEERIGKNVFQTGAGVIGASIGAALGTPVGPIGSMIGAMAGGMITSVAMTFAIDNGIEKPFREIMDNTKSLAYAENIMANSVSYMVQAESMFEDFKVGLFLSERDFNHSMEQIRQKREANLGKLNL